MKIKRSLYTGKVLLFIVLLLTGFTLKAQEQEFSRTRIALNGGWGYRTARTSPYVPAEYRDLINGLRSGFNYSADFTYYFSEHFGAGAKYNHFSTSVSTKGDSSYMGIKEMNVGITFIGGSAGARIYNRAHSGALIIGLSLGYLGYSETGIIENKSYKATGGTFGGVWDLGYDFQITDKIAVGAQLSLLSGVLRSYTKESNGTRETINLNSDQYENLGRIDISGGIRFTL